MGVTQRVVTYWCASGFFKSATKVGRDWVIIANDLKGFVPPKPGPKPRARADRTALTDGASGARRQRRRPGREGGEA